MTKEEIAKYLKDQLRLEVKSAPVRKGDDSLYAYQISLKLEGQVISSVNFNA